jgi:hypothetical protein
MVTKLYNEKTTHNNKYETVNALVLNVSRGDYTCYKKVDCDKCAQPGIIDKGCDTLIAEKKTGNCRSGKSECCQESCYRYNDDIIIFCGKKSSYCNLNCYCSNLNPTPACRVISGQCYKPSVKVSFYDKTGTKIIAIATNDCGINELKCATNFIKGISINQYIDIDYNINDPQQIYIDKRPKFKGKGGTITGIVFGVLFLIVGISLCIAAFLMS